MKRLPVLLFFLGPIAWQALTSVWPPARRTDDAFNRGRRSSSRRGQRKGDRRQNDESKGCLEERGNQCPRHVAAQHDYLTRQSQTP